MTLGFEGNEFYIDGTWAPQLVGRDFTSLQVRCRVCRGTQRTAQTAPQVDDADWMRQCAAVRDRMQEARGARGDRDALLTAIGDPGITAAAGVIDAASRRGLGIVLDTASTLAAALVVERSERRLSRTWLAGTRSDEPAQHRAIDRLELQPVVPLGSRRVGVGGLAAVPVIRAAVRAAAQEEPQH